MEIRQLITFIRVVQFQSFSKAAESLGYSQSAVTIQIKNLEQDLNTHLFDRIGKRVSLTPQGEKFLTYAYNIINEMNHAKVALDDKKELTGSLKIGTVESLCFTKFPQILKKMRELHPGVSIQLKATIPEEALEMMEHNEVDLVYILDDANHNSNWHKAMEVEENIVFVCSPEYAVTRQAEIRVVHLLKYPFLLTEKDASYHKKLDQMLGEQGEKVDKVISLAIKDETIFKRIANRALIEGRKDDADPATIQNRIDTYHQKTEPLIGYYKEKGNYCEIPGEQTIEEVFSCICKELE